MSNRLIREVAKKHTSNIKKCELCKNAIIYTDVNDKKFVAKKNDNNILELYNYLNSRGFDYLPRLVYSDNKGYVYEYEKDTLMPEEQKMSDLVKIDALLHNKTVFYKDTYIDEIKELYENLSEKIKNTFNYYDDILTMIESKVYMSPSEYMLARNSSSIFSCINFCRKELDEWYEIISKKNKKRVVLLHNNLSKDHLIRSDENILISWDHVLFDMPIYDFIKLYKENYNKYDFSELYRQYQKTFPLLEEEKKLLFTILFIPDKITFKNDEFMSTIEVGKLCNYLYVTDNLFMENEAKNAKEQDHNINE